MALLKTRKFKLTRRRVPKPAPQTAAQLQFYAELKGMLARVRQLVEERVLPRLPELLDGREDAAHTDAKPRSINRVLDQISASTFNRWPQERMEKLSVRIASIASEHQKRELQRQLKVATGLDLSASIDRGLRKAVEQFTAENVALIKTIPQKFLDDVERAVLSGARAGNRSTEVAAVITERFEISERRARDIARDQVLKFNGDLNKTRQQNLGVDKFIWRTAGDNRTREVHAERDGQTYSWDDPPGDASDPGDGAFPGDGINCRCWAEPVIPDLAQEDDES